MTTKQIHRQLGDPVATIDNRIVEAARILGVKGRHAAAETLQALERISNEPPAVPQWPDKPPSVGQASGRAAPEKQEVRSYPWPFPTAGRPWNDLTLGARITSIIALAILIAIFVGGLTVGGVSTIDYLSRLADNHPATFWYTRQERAVPP